MSSFLEGEELQDSKALKSHFLITSKDRWEILIRGGGRMMEKIESEEFGTPRGGPIYISNMVGPLTRVPEFEASVFHELQNLDAEVCLDSSGLWDGDLSVDQLKVYTEEELVDMALKEAFEDEENVESLSQRSEDCSDMGYLESIDRGDKALAFQSTASHSRANNKAIKKENYSKKKKRRRANSSVDINIPKVERLKRKQDEEKAAARLHSFNSSCKINECPISTSENTERMKSLRYTNSVLRSSNIQEHIPVLYPEIVLSIEVYHNIRKWVKTQEFLVLGQQTLTELRDRIYCLTDQVMEKAGLYDPSGYFLIEDVFYNDLRNPSAIDYSKPLLDWLRNSKDDALKKWECIINGELRQKQRAILGSVSTSQLPHFKAGEMHKNRFCDLRFRVGAGYLYCHQGDCKHTIVIRDMRLIHADDVQNRMAYPIVIFQLKPRVQKCNVCKMYRATRVTVDDKWAQENPCYFCDYCYSLLYSQDCSPPSNFSVYDDLQY